MNRRTFSIILSVLSGVCFGVAFTTYLLTTGSFSKTYKAYIVESGSMEPNISVGAVVVTKSATDFQKGDIITFTPKNSKETITHRIYSIESADGATVFRTKGDANEESDNWEVSPTQIVGKEMLIIPKLGYLANFVRTPKGFVALVVIPASILIYEELKTIFKELKNMIFKKKDGEGDGTSKAAAAIPIMGIMLVFISTTSSFSLDRETSPGNFFGEAATPTPVINEILPHPDTVFENEWVELYNPSGSAIDLTDWSLVDAANNTKGLSGSIPANGFYVFDDGSAWLNNTGDETVYLKDSGDNTIDSFFYNSTSPDKSIGRETDGGNVFKECTNASKGGTNNGAC